MRRPSPKVPRLLYVRSLLPPVCFYLFFFILLSVWGILAHSEGQPGPAGRMGWQVNEAIQLYAPKSGAVTGDGSNGSSNGTAIFDELSGDGIDGALPLDIWDPLMPHRTGLTAIAVKACVFSPDLFGDICAPESTPEDDARLGKWVRVEKDLNQVAGIWFLSIYYRRSRRFDVPYVTSLVVLENGVPVPPGFIKAAGDDLNSGAWPREPTLSLAYKLRYPPGLAAPDVAGEDHDDKEQDDEDGAVEEKKVVTEIDVVYGDGPPWWGFLRVRPLVRNRTTKHPESVGIVVRMGVPDVPQAPELRMTADGKFRILQVADLHYSVGDGECRDTDKNPCVGDVDSAALLERVLDAEKPDLVVFSGDQLNGQKTTWDAMSVLAKFATPVIDRKIPWAAIFGNHDGQDGTSKADQMKAISRMPYSLSQAGPQSIHGVGNYMLKVFSNDSSKIHLTSIYLLDSGDYMPTPSWNPFAKLEYDYIHESQTDWYLSTSASIKPVERPFVPDGAEDLDGIWQRGQRSGQPARLARQASAAPVVTLRKPNALAFFHIPLREHNDSPDVDPDTGVPLDVGLSYEEGGSSKQNGGFFWDGLKQAFTGEYSQAGVALNEVKVVANGHVHTNDNCRRTSGIWHCFGGGGSYSGYGRKDLPRRFRVYDISEFGERIATYKHTEDDLIVDQMDLFGGEAPPVGD